jgi:hypothetical protein
MSGRTAVAPALLLAFALAPLRAAADAPPAAGAPRADTVEAPADESPKRIDRTWLYVDDARIPGPLKVIGMFNATYTNVGSPTRIGGASTYKALALNTAQPGGQVGIGGEVGLFSHVAIMTMVQVGAGGDGPSPSAGLVAGVRVQAFPSAWRDTHLVVSAGYLREAWQGARYNDDSGKWVAGKPYGDSGVWAQAAFSQDLARVRLATTVHVEHVFAEGRDPIDLMIQAGASVRVVGGFRLGAEYVVQDLEEAGASEAEGGVRHFLGPTASLQILRDRLSIVAGPSFGLSRHSPELIGRAAAAFGF